MIIAPVQLHQLSFRRVSVEVDPGRFDKGELDETTKGFDFEGVVIGTHVGFSPMAPDSELPGLNFLLTLRVKIDNKGPSDDSAWRPSIYLVDIEVGAIIRVADGAEKFGDIEDLVAVNGASMLWAAIREQVCNLTARMSLGVATLPTVHFQDLRKHRPKAATAQSKSGAPRVAKTRSKTPS